MRLESQVANRPPNRGNSKQAPDAPFVRSLRLIEKGADDERNFVKKGVSWALRSIGRRRALTKAAVETAQRLAESSEPAARWVGNDALRDFAKAKRSVTRKQPS